MLFLPTNVLEQADELRFSLSSLGRNLLKVSGFYAANGGGAASSCITPPQILQYRDSFVRNSVPAPVISYQDALPQSRGPQSTASERPPAPELPPFIFS